MAPTHQEPELENLRDFFKMNSEALLEAQQPDKAIPETADP